MERQIAAAARLTGIDASHHQGTPDWAQVRNAGHSFAILKATEGTSYSFTNWYRTHAPRVTAAGIVPGAYHFLRADSDPAAQARYFVATVGSFDGLLAAVDVETGADGSHPTAAAARAFTAEFHRLVPGHPLLVYTGRWYWRDTIGNPTGADIGPLWHSAYSDKPGAMYGGWPDCTFWQFTSSGTVPGVAGNCDVNQFHGGGRPELLALTTPQEDDMPLSPADLDAVAARLAPLMARAADDAAKQNAKFLSLGGTSTLFDPGADGNGWMAGAVTLTKLIAAVGDVDEDEIARQVLGVLSPAAIAAALPDDIAAQVADELHARLAD